MVLLWCRRGLRVRSFTSPPCLRWMSLTPKESFNQRVEEDIAGFAEAIQLELSLGRKPKVEQFRKLLSSLTKLDRLSQGYEALELMRAENLPPDATVLSYMIKLLSNAGESQAVIKLYTSFIESGGAPNVKMFESLARFYASVYDVDGIHRLLLHMQKFKVPVTQKVYRYLIDADSKSGSSQVAEEVFQRVTDEKRGFGHLSMGIVESLMKTYLRTDEHVKLLKLYESLHLYDLQPSIFCKQFLILSYGKVGGVKKAQAIFKEIVQSHEKVPVGIVRSMLTALAEQGMVSATMSLFKRIEELTGQPPQTPHYNVVLVAYDRAGRFRRMREMYDWMVADCGIAPDIYTYLTLIRASSRRGFFEDMPLIYSQMQERNIAVTQSAICIPLAAAAKLGETSAVQSFLKMLRMNHFRPNEDVKAAFAYSQLRNTKTFDAFEFIRKENITEEKEFKAVVAACAERGEVQTMMDVYQGMQERNLRPSKGLLRIIMDGCRRAGRASLLYKMTRSYQEWGYAPDRALLSSVINSLVVFRDNDRIVSVVNNMIDRGMTIDVSVYDSLSSYLDKLNVAEVGLQEVNRLRVLCVRMAPYVQRVNRLPRKDVDKKASHLLTLDTLRREQTRQADAFELIGDDDPVEIIRRMKLLSF